MGLFLLILATTGLAAVFHAWMDLPAAFCPAAAVAGEILTLYALSLVGLLRWGPWLVCGAGLICLAVMLATRRQVLIDLFSPGMVCFFLYAGVLWALNVGRVPDGFDNYSHWALAAKELYLTHALPGQDTLVTMTNYPPAVPLFQYMVLRLAGFSEGAMLGANGLLLGAMLSCLLGDCRWKDRRWLFGGAALAALTLVIPNCSVNLQVDAMLGAMALALGCAALWDGEKTRPVQGLLASVLVLTKMSGVVLLALHWALAVCLWRRRAGGRRELLRWAGWCGVLPAAMYGLFALRIRVVFAGALARNQFQVGAASFGAKLAAKSPAFWASFPGDFWRALWDGQTGASVFFLAGNAVLAVLLVLFLCKRLPAPKNAVFVIVFSWAALAVYTANLAGMYLFMMDENESIILASFYRYFGTGVLYQLGLCAAALLPGTEADSPVLPPLLLTAALALACVGALRPQSDWELQSRAAREALRREVLSARDGVTARWDGETMLYCAADQTHLSEDYVYRFVRYAFFSSHVRPMGPGLTRAEDLTPEGACYILWLEEDAWAAQTLTDAGITPPAGPGLYYKDGQTLVKQ